MSISDSQIAICYEGCMIIFTIRRILESLFHLIINTTI